MPATPAALALQQARSLCHDALLCLPLLAQGKVRSIPLLCVLKVVQGQTTPVFRRDPLPEYEGLSFSLLYAEGGGGSGSGGLLLSSPKARSLDVVCRSQAEFETW
jgi:hypothetical protein